MAEKMESITKIIESDFCVRYTASKLINVMESGRITQTNPVTGAASVEILLFSIKGRNRNGKIYFIIGPGNNKLAGYSF